VTVTGTQIGGRQKLPWGLRAVAIAIAVLGWLDPSYAGRARPRVAVLDATASSSNATSPLAARVAAQLSDTAVVTAHADPDADAWVVVADDDEARVPRMPEGIALSLVTPPAPAQRVVVESIDAPARVEPGSPVPLVATLASKGLRGAQSTIVVRSGDLPLARATHRWTRDEERVTVRFDVLLPREGVNHLIVEAVDGPGRTRRSRADTAVEAHPTPISVLVYEGRPSWTTTFARRAIERDGPFMVSGVARVSRGVTTTATMAQSPLGDRLTADLLEPQSVVIVGAPETLTASEVEALRSFVARGGVVVFAPDQRPSGPYTSVLAGASLDERLLEDAVRLPLTDSPELALTASELIEATTLPAGALAIAPGSRADRAIVWTVPHGRGQMVFVGALDAWRYRSNKDDAFDRFWSQMLTWLGRDRQENDSVWCEPRVAAPGEPVAVGVRDEPRGERGSALRVAIAATQPAVQRVEEPRRLWPDAAADTFSGVINAPERPGVYAVSATSGPADAHGSGFRASLAPLVVDAAARRARRTDDRWRAATEARGGVVATPDEIDRVARAVAAPTNGRARADQVHPMRSLWWLLPFTACLGGEWLLRRRAGLR
jgi:hypothetical protein